MSTTTHARTTGRPAPRRPDGQRWGIAVVAALPAILVTLALPLAIQGSLVGFILLPLVLLTVAVTAGLGGFAGVAIVLLGTVAGALIGTGGPASTPLLGAGLAGVLLAGTWLGQVLSAGRWPVAAAIPAIGLVTGIFAVGVTGRLEAGVLAAFTGLSLTLLLVLVGPWNGTNAMRPARWVEVLAVVTMAVSAIATYAVSIATPPLLGSARTLDVFAGDQPTGRTEGGVPDPFLTAARWQLEPGYENLTVFAIAGPEGLEQRPTWATFANYNGIAWFEPATYGVSGTDIPPELIGAPRQALTLGARVTVAVGLPGQWVPVPQRVARVVSTVETRADPESGIVAAVGSPIDRSFDIAYTAAVADGEQLRATFPAQGSGSEPAMALPAPLSGRMAALADEVAASSPDTWDRLVSLSQELRGDSYSAVAPAALGAGAPDRTYAGLDLVLAEGVGFQEQYAAIWAVIARSWDVPTRLVIGFPLPAGGPAVQTVTANEVSVWAEARLDGLGWVAFQPSPQDRAAGRPAVVRPIAPGDIPANPDSGSGGGSSLRPDLPGEDTAAADGSAAGSSLPWAWLLVAVVVLAVIIWPVAVAVRRRRLRARLAAGDPRDSSRGAWTWTRLLLAEAWLPLPPSYAPAADALPPPDLPDELAASVTRLAQVIAPIAYGRQPQPAEAVAAWEAADALGRDVRRATGWRTALRRILIPLANP